MTKLLPTRDYFRNNVAFRNDTLLGVCESLGRDLGFNPNLLRVPLAAGIIFAPALMVGIYLGLGALVFAIRTFAPDRFERIELAEQAVPVAADNQEVELAQAA